jgi:hypothetical protein
VYLEQLRSFCAVVDLGSYTRAGRQLALTQPAVSQHVRSLEQRFGYLCSSGSVAGYTRLTLVTLYIGTPLKSSSRPIRCIAPFSH